jgi:hypothetical protein
MRLTRKGDFTKYLRNGMDGKYDPTNLFRVNQNIEPGRWGAPTEGIRVGSPSEAAEGAF